MRISLHAIKRFLEREHGHTETTDLAFKLNQKLYQKEITLAKKTINASFEDSIELKDNTKEEGVRFFVDKNKLLLMLFNEDTIITVYKLKFTEDDKFNHDYLKSLVNSYKRNARAAEKLEKVLVKERTRRKKQQTKLELRMAKVLADLKKLDQLRDQLKAGAETIMKEYTEEVLNKCQKELD